MATATAAPAVEAAAEPAPRRRRTLLIAIVLVVLLGGGGAAYLLTKGSGHAAAAAPTPGAVVDLEPLTLNLADGRFLKVGLSLQLSADAPAAKGSEGGVNGAKARDAAIGIFGQRSYQQLLSPKGRAAALTALDTEVRKRYDGEVLQVYLTEFVMQ